MPSPQRPSHCCRVDGVAKFAGCQRFLDLRKPGPHAVEASFHALTQRTRDILARGETISSVAVFKDGDIEPASVLLEVAHGAPKGTVRLELLARPDQTCELPRGIEFELCAGRELLGRGRIAATDEMATAQRDQLLIAITRCSHVEYACTDPSHPCAAVVRDQEGDVAKFQVPEPWSGHIECAPILFVGSNPSISKDEVFPTSSWSEAKTKDFFQRRFDKDGSWAERMPFKSVKYWTHVRERATELLERAAVEGRDFALTEVVHCKVKNQDGVKDALPVCMQMWFDRVLSQSAARVIVLLGAHARDACTKHWNIDGGRSVHFDVAIAGRYCAVVILPHPNARVPRTLDARTSAEERRTLRTILREGQ